MTGRSSNNNVNNRQLKHLTISCTLSIAFGKLTCTKYIYHTAYVALDNFSESFSILEDVFIKRQNNVDLLSQHSVAACMRRKLQMERFREKT